MVGGRQLSATQPVSDSVGGGGGSDNDNAIVRKSPRDVDFAATERGVGVVQIVDPLAENHSMVAGLVAAAASGGYTMGKQSGAGAEELEHRERGGYTMGKHSARVEESEHRKRGGYNMGKQSARVEKPEYREPVSEGKGGGGVRRRLLHAVGAERHCMHQLVAANLATMRP